MSRGWQSERFAAGDNVRWHPELQEKDLAVLRGLGDLIDGPITLSAVEQVGGQCNCGAGPGPIGHHEQCRARNVAGPMAGQYVIAEINGREKRYSAWWFTHAS